MDLASVARGMNLDPAARLSDRQRLDFVQHGPLAEDEGG